MSYQFSPVTEDFLALASEHEDRHSAGDETDPLAFDEGAECEHAADELGEGEDDSPIYPDDNDAHADFNDGEFW